MFSSSHTHRHTNTRRRRGRHIVAAFHFTFFSPSSSSSSSFGSSSFMLFYFINLKWVEVESACVLCVVCLNRNKWIWVECVGKRCKESLNGTHVKRDENKILQLNWDTACSHWSYSNRKWWKWCCSTLLMIVMTMTLGHSKSSWRRLSGREWDRESNSLNKIVCIIQSYCVFGRRCCILIHPNRIFGGVIKGTCHILCVVVVCL